MAFTPIKTLSGAGFPLLTGVSADGSTTAITKGDVVYFDATAGKWKVGSNPETTTNLIGVALQGTSSATGSIDVCIARDDVIFDVDQGTTQLAATNHGIPKQFNSDGGTVTTTNAAATNPHAVVIPGTESQDDANHYHYNVILKPGTP